MQLPAYEVEMGLILRLSTTLNHFLRSRHLGHIICATDSENLFFPRFVLLVLGPELKGVS